MEKISLNQIPAENSFTEDCFILDDLFFLPKKLPIRDYHIRLLRKWNIVEISTEGQTTKQGMNKIIKSDDDEKGKLNVNKLFPDSPSNVEDIISSIEEKNGSEIEDFEITEAKETSSLKLLDSSVKDFIEIYKGWIKKVYSIFHGLLAQKTVDKEDVKKFIVEIIKTVNKNRNNALMVIGKDFKGVPKIYPQTLETVILSFILGESLTLPDLALSNLAIAALFHDVGMIRIPAEILDKTEKLNEKDISIIQNHTLLGFKLLRDVKYSAIIASGALQHHERIDGKGYPNKLPPERVTEIAKIISVADAYCAAISNKPYKNSLLHGKEAIQDLLRGGGTAYEPGILKELIKNISFYPIGSLVLLSNEKSARIVGTSGIPMKPIVKMIDSPEGIGIINLSKNNDIFIKGAYTNKPQ